MNKVVLTLVALLIWVLIMLFLPQADESTQRAVELSREISEQLVDSVKAALFNELEKGGYINAIRACSNLAQDIIRTYQERYKVYVRRVSEKYRNELDRPDDYELQVLKKLDELNKQGQLPGEYYEVVRENGERYLRYFKPLIVQPMCLNCHGADGFLSKDIKEFLKKRYPNDKATGYQAGDFRGAVSVKVKLSDTK